MTLPRLLLVALVLTAVTALAAAVTGVVRAGDRPSSGSVAVRPAPDPDAAREPGRAPTDRGAAALAVLRAWDGRRAAAWAAGDVAQLGRLYTAGSAAGRRDRAMLRGYVARGLRVRGLRMQVLTASVRDRSADRIVLDVTDRLAHAVAVGRGVRGGLPRDRATRRTVVLRRDAGEWRVQDVRAQARPAARMARTSRSRNS